jgi:hypothetical protein
MREEERANTGHEEDRMHTSGERRCCRSPWSRNTSREVDLIEPLDEEAAVVSAGCLHRWPPPQAPSSSPYQARVWALVVGGGAVAARV